MLKLLSFGSTTASSLSKFDEAIDVLGVSFSREAIFSRHNNFLGSLSVRRGPKVPCYLDERDLGDALGLKSPKIV